MKKELLSTIILLLICILLLLGCKSEDIDNREKNTEGSTDELIKNNTTDSREAYLKDMACNTLNGGAVTYDDEKIYYVLDESLWSMNKDGSSQEKLCQRNAENIWSDGENVYFLYEKKLYAVNKETKEEKLMLDKEMSTFFITEDKLYYVSENVLYVSSLSNTDAFQCIDKFAFMPVTDGQNIYYNYGTGIKVIGLKDMEEKIYRGSCRMN